jgi:hypothetical protein
VLSHSSTLTWLSSSFLASKKDSCVRWISDYQELNKHIKCKIDNLPKIQDILSCCYGYKYFTKLDIHAVILLNSMNSTKVVYNLHIVWYHYHLLPMGVSTLSGIIPISFQWVSHRPQTFDEADIRINDIGVTAQSHLLLKTLNVC